MDRFTQLGVTAALMAVNDAKLEINRENSERIGVTIGTSLAGLSFGEKQYEILKERGPDRERGKLLVNKIKQKYSKK